MFLIFKNLNKLDISEISEFKKRSFSYLDLFCAYFMFNNFYLELLYLY
jgi:hypothetical protein